MERIVIVGSPGSGKSVFSRKLSKLLNIEAYHLDNIWWNKDKTHITREEFDVKLNEIVNKEKWIIDGDYSRTYEVRIKACDTIFFLDYPLDLCLEGAKKRIGTLRDDIPWIESEFDPEFKEWIINWPKDIKIKLLTLLEKYENEKEIVVFKTREEANLYLKNRGFKE